jgi:hypothetical protein
MNRNVTTLIGVVAAIVIAWFLVNLLFSFIFFVVKLLIVAFVAVLVYFALRGVLGRSTE